MTDSHCTRIDSYIDGFATEQQRIEVERHLKRCDACRAIVEQHREYDRALRRHAATINPPKHLAEPMALAHSGRQKVRRLFVVVAAVAASLILPVVIHFRRDQGSGRPLVDRTFQPTPKAPPSEAPIDRTKLAIASSPQINAVDSSTHVVVIDPESEDDITFVMLYPIIQSNRE